MKPRKDYSERPAQAAIYIRVSTDKQVRSGLGLEDQLDKTTAESKRLGYEVSNDFIFVDEGISGKKNGDKRPSYGRMMKLVEQGIVTAVIVNDLSRLGRSVLLISKALELFEMNGCIFISVKESFNTSGAMGKAMLNMIATFAQLESDLASERTEDALQVRGDKYGYKSGQLPYGYTRISHTEDAKSNEVISIDDNEASIVRAIFSLRDKGISMQGIADRMNAISKSPRGSKWYASSIKIVLDNKAYYIGEKDKYPAIM